jgi:hypothetical protein
MGKFFFNIKPWKIHFFDMNYPISNTQGKIHAMHHPKDAYLFIELIPHGNTLLGKFLFREGRTFKFENRIGEALRQNLVHWQIEGIKNEYFIPIEESFFYYCQKTEPDEVVKIRIQM